MEAILQQKTPRAIWIKRNHNDKRELVGQGHSRGILVYWHGAPVGWCQYGLMEELPRIDNNPKYRKLESASDKMLWRITCFVVRKIYRRRGVARTALKAALAAIQKQGGGVVEAYPIKRWGAPTTEELYPCSRRRSSKSSPRWAKAMC
jgi:hypothetical protein